MISRETAGKLYWISKIFNCRKTDSIIHSLEIYAADQIHINVFLTNAIKIMQPFLPFLPLSEYIYLKYQLLYSLHLSSIHIYSYLLRSIMNYYCSVENSGNKQTNFITRPQLKLQGPRPTALTVSKSSKKAMAKKKPNPSNPVIVYLISPKIIHVQPEEFMGLVQRLTGNDHQGPRRVNHIVVNSQSCSNSSTSGLSQGDQYFIESQQTLTSKRVDYADVPVGIPTTSTTNFIYWYINFS